MKAALSATKISTLKPAEKPYEVHDTRVPGLIVRVQPTGFKVWYLVFSRSQRLRLGPTSTITTAQARILATEKLALAYTGEDPRNVRRDKTITYAAFVDDVYGPWAEVHLKRAKTNQQRLHRRFQSLRRKQLSQITLEEVERWRTGRLKEGRLPTTINRDTDSLKALLNKARLWGYLTQNPLVEMRRLQVDRSPRVRYLSKDEEGRLRKAIHEREARLRAERSSANAWRSERNYPLLPDLNSHVFADYLQPMVLLSVNTGMRQGEVFSLCWDDVDIAGKLLTVRGETAKSGQTRHLPLNDEALDSLRAWRMQTGKSHGLIFPGREGQRRNNVYKSWQSVLKVAEISGFRWHDLRHHFASKLVMAGVDLNTIRELLGHSTYQMTLRYVHLAPNHKAGAVAKLLADDYQSAMNVHSLKANEHVPHIKPNPERDAHQTSEATHERNVISSTR